MPEMMPSAAGVAFDLNAALDAISAKQDKDAEKKFQDTERAKYLESLSRLSTGADKPAVLSTFAVSETRIRGAYEAGMKALQENQGEEKIDHALDKLAEGYALRGDFYEASILATDATRRAEYERLAEARKRGETQCPCPSPQSFIKQKLFTGEKILVIEECVKCRTLRCYER